MFGDSCLTLCLDLEDVVCFVQVFWFLYPHRRVGLMGLALGCLVYFCLLAKTEFSCWTFVSCLENVFLWRVDVIVYSCDCVSWYGMLMWLMCCSVCWIPTNWVIRNLCWDYLYNGRNIPKVLYFILFIFQ